MREEMSKREGDFCSFVLMVSAQINNFSVMSG